MKGLREHKNYEHIVEYVLKKEVIYLVVIMGKRKVSVPKKNLTPVDLQNYGLPQSYNIMMLTITFLFTAVPSLPPQGCVIP